MKSYRKHHRELEDDDSLCYMTEVNKGAQKIMVDIPDQLTSVFSWTILTGLFIIFLVGTIYLVLRFESPDNLKTTFKDTDRYESSAFNAPELPITEKLITRRKLCSTLSKDLYSSVEQMGSNINRRMSKFMALQNINSGDVHYVFTNNTHVPWLFICSLESALKATDNNNRVNVFIVDGIEFQHPMYDEQSLNLTAMNISDRLNVIHITLEECLKGSPFQGLDLSKHPALATFAVRLVLLWQFGGTVLDDDVVMIGGEDVYRASETAVEYGDKMMSAPFACHASVYDAMLNAKQSYSVYARRSNAIINSRTSDQGIYRTIKKNTVERTRRARRDDEFRPVADGIVCRGVINDRCHYLEVDHVTSDNSYYVHDYVCPIFSKSSPFAAGEYDHANDHAGD